MKNAIYLSAGLIPMVYLPVHTRPSLLLLVPLLAACGAGTAAMSDPPANASAAAPPPAAAASEWRVPPAPAPAPISRSEFAARREALARALTEDGVFVAFGSPEPQTDYSTFAQNSPFRYLTGITEPGAALVMIKSGGTYTEQLFVLERNPAREVWEGARLGAEGARALTGIPATTVDRLFPALDSLLAKHPRLYTMSAAPGDARQGQVLGRDAQLVQHITARHSGIETVDVSDEVSRIRAGKTPAELDMLRRSIYITNLAQRAAMRAIEPGMNEFEIQALIEYTFRRYGSERPGFATIVGSGPNSTTLHYNADDRFMNAGEVVVMDIGAAYGGYSADITRTVPVSGRFSDDQKAIYEIVLAAQKAAEAVLRPGATRQQLGDAANAVLSEGLARLGLIEAADATYDCQGASGLSQCPQYRMFYMHGLGHGIGLDVHDPDASYYGTFALRSAFTIEPGIYVRADVLDYLPDTPGNRAMIQRLRPAVQQYQNIGVRIEDDYFVTATGAERVSEGAPREIDEIEALMAQPAGAGVRQGDIVEWYRGASPAGRR